MFGVNNWPFKSTAGKTDSGGDFRHGGKLNALWVDGHVDPCNEGMLLGTSAKYIYHP